MRKIINSAGAYEGCFWELAHVTRTVLNPGNSSSEFAHTGAVLEFPIKYSNSDSQQAYIMEMQIIK